MSQIKIASRYAKSLVDLSREKSSLDSVYQDILTVNMVCNNRDFQLMLKSPIVQTDKKEKVINSLFGNNTSDLVRQFIHILISKGRESLLPQICQAFIEQYKAIKKIKTATLITAIPQTDDQLNMFKQQFQSWLKSGETMEILHRLDPGLIGGFIFQMDGKQVDATAKRKIDLFRTNLYDSSYTNLVVKS